MGSFGPDQHGTRHVYKNATIPLSSTFLGCTTEVLRVMLDTTEGGRRESLYDSDYKHRPLVRLSTVRTKPFDPAMRSQFKRAKYAKVVVRVLESYKARWTTHCFIVDLSRKFPKGDDGRWRNVRLCHVIIH
jgi:hypothetical protein